MKDIPSWTSQAKAILRKFITSALIGADPLVTSNI